jgi:N-acetylneuraminate synthase
MSTSILSLLGESHSSAHGVKTTPTKIPVIAEVGINHNGDLEIAKQLIVAAHEAGCAAVKFQKRTIEIVYSAEVLDSPRDSPWGSTQRDQKFGLEFSLDEYREIDAFCKTLGIDWTASAWDVPSLHFIEAFSPSFHKVASAMITNQGFLQEVADLGRLTLLSTGMASLEDIDRAVGIFKNSKSSLVLLHTVSTYPTPEEDLNLRTIETLRERYELPVGYSGHEASVSPSIVAAALGAVVIERHVTLDRTMYGSDQAASLESNGLRQLVSVIDKIPTILGTGEKDWAPGEREVAAKLRYWE